MATLSENKSSKVLSEIWFKGSPKIQIDLNRINKLASLGLPRRVPCNVEDSPPSTKTCAGSSDVKKRKAEIDARDLELEGEGGPRNSIDEISAEAQGRKAINLAKEILSIRDKDKENINPGGEYYKGLDVRKHASLGERSEEKKRVLQVSNKLQNSLPSSGNRKVGSLLMKQSSKFRVRKDPDCVGGSKLLTNRDEDWGSYQQQIDCDKLSHIDSKNNSRPLQFIDASRHVDTDGQRERKCNEILKEVGFKPPVSVANCLEAPQTNRESEGNWSGTLKEVGSNPSVTVQKYLQRLQENKENQGNCYDISKDVQIKSPISVANQLEVLQNDMGRDGKWYETIRHVGSKPPISGVNHLEIQYTDRESERKRHATSKEVRCNSSISVDKYMQLLETNREIQENCYDTSKEVDSRPAISVATRLEVLQNDREREGKWYESSKEIVSKLPMINCLDVQHTDKESEGKWYKTSKEVESKAPISVANYLEVQESSMSSVIVESEQNGPFSTSAKQLSSSMNGSVKQLSSYMNGLTIIDTSFHDLQTSTVEEKGGLKNESDKDIHGLFGTESKHTIPNCQGVTSDAYRSSIPAMSSTTCSITVRTSSAPLATSYTDENVQHLSPKNMQSLSRLSPVVADKPSQGQYEIQPSNSGMERKELKSPVKVALAENRVRKPPDEIPVSDIGPSKIGKKVVNQGDIVLQPRKHVENENMVVVNGKKYQKLKKIGRGGSSEVFKVLDREHNVYALKRIKLKGRDYGTARGFYEEIELLTRLQGKKYIIKLIDHEVTDKTLFSGNEAESSIIKHDVNIYMVLEFGEVDLATMLQEKLKEKTDGNHNVDEDWLRFYWKQILEAVNTVHEGRIMHGDLKPANFLLVKGVLKLIDFGIAKSIQSDTTNIERESQVGTLNYMSPEAFLMNEKDENGNVIKCGRSSDIWALGCILYQMVYGKTPFAHITSLHAKIQEVANPRHKINYLPLSNPHLLDIMKKCLTYNRDERSRIPELLGHPFLQPERNVGGKVEAEILEEIRVEEARGRDTAALRRVLQRMKMLSL